MIFAGKYYISSTHEEESDADVTLLAQSLRAAAAFPHVKFILLSSIEVYGKTSGRADESAERAAVSERVWHTALYVIRMRDFQYAENLETTGFLGRSTHHGVPVRTTCFLLILYRPISKKLANPMCRL